MEIQIYSFFFQNIFTQKMWGKCNNSSNSKIVIVLSKMHFKKDNGNENNINVAKWAKIFKKVQLFREFSILFASKAKISGIFNWVATKLPELWRIFSKNIDFGLFNTT